MSKSEVSKTTIDLFGREVGQRLLDNRVILPVKADKSPAQGFFRYNDGADLDKPFGSYEGLAIINGPLSGIVAVDLDSTDLNPPVELNVRSRKGGHIFLPWQGQKRQTRIAPSVDMLGAGGYSIFTGPGKEFISPKLADPRFVTDWLASLPPPP